MSDDCDDCIEEIIQLLKNELDQLKQELVNKIKERDKATKTFSELSLDVPFWKKPFLPLLKELVKRKLRGLKRIPALEEQIEHYEGGLAHLEQGIYSSAISLLKQLALVYSVREMNIMMRLGIEGTKYGEILKLIEQLEQFTALEKSGEKEPL